MCVNPIDIINPSKYISLRHRNQYILQIPCGSCCECQRTLSNQWFYRTYFEWLDIIKLGGFVYFDTLTYDDAHLPYMDDELPFISHHPCFCPDHVRHFTQNLRDRLKHRNANYRYLIVSEYGALRKRPHYHLLLFVLGVHPLDLSKMISDVWKYGRTDGIPFKSANYVLNHNTKKSDLETILSVSNYVTKYIQKSCIYDETLDSRLKSAMLQYKNHLFPDDDDWLDSPAASRIRSEFKRKIAQRHWQSQHFGESALSNLDLNQLFNDGVLYMPSSDNIKMPVPLPTYYKRKLFYDLIEIDGTKSWQLNDLGKQYKAYRKNTLIDSLASTFKCAGLLGNFTFDWKGLAEYVYNIRGRIRADNDEATIEERLMSGIDLYNYSTLADKESVGCGVTPLFVGNSSIGYNTKLTSANSLTFRRFIASHVMFDDVKERQLSKIYAVLNSKGKQKQKAYKLKQRLENLYKTMGIK